MTGVDEAKRKLCAWVQSQVGTHEGENNWNIYANMPSLERLYGGRIQNAPWCDIFTDAAFISCFGLERGAAMTYQTIGGGSALCRDSAMYFSENGAFTFRPEIGAVIFFLIDGAINHMGIVTGVSGGSIFTVEGNVADQVSERCYSVNDPSIAGYGIPRWELVAGGDANSSASVEKKEACTKMQGVDISHYQAGLTIQQLRDAGMDFAILKVTEGTYLKDESAFEFYRQAYELGFPVGCYCYSHAINAQQAMGEAAFLMDTIKGFPMPCGVFLDIEEQKTLDLPHDTLLNVIRGWCAGIGGRGYIPGIYSSEGTLWSKISPDELPDGCLVWVAKWSNAQPSMRCDVWQNSDNGRVDGYGGPIDTDVGVSEYFQALVGMTDYPKANVAQSTTSGVTETAPDACPIFPPDPAVMVLQLLLGYYHQWGKPDGQKSPEFFTAIRRFIDGLEK